MLFFVIELDEERILKDNKINLDAAYRTINNNFAREGITLYKKDGNERWYTRNIDMDDFSTLWMMNSLFKKEAWFCYYVKQWRFLDLDDESGYVYENEDVLEEWVKIRPKNP